MSLSLSKIVWLTPVINDPELAMRRLAWSTEPETSMPHPDLPVERDPVAETCHASTVADVEPVEEAQPYKLYLDFDKIESWIRDIEVAFEDYGVQVQSSAQVWATDSSDKPDKVFDSFVLPEIPPLDQGFDLKVLHDDDHERCGPVPDGLILPGMTFQGLSLDADKAMSKLLANKAHEKPKEALEEWKKAHEEPCDDFGLPTLVSPALSFKIDEFFAANSLGRSITSTTGRDTASTVFSRAQTGSKDAVQSETTATSGSDRSSILDDKKWMIEIAYYLEEGAEPVTSNASNGEISCKNIVLVETTEQTTEQVTDQVERITIEANAGVVSSEENVQEHNDNEAVRVVDSVATPVDEVEELEQPGLKQTYAVANSSLTEIEENAINVVSVPASKQIGGLDVETSANVISTDQIMHEANDEVKSAPDLGASINENEELETFHGVVAPINDGEEARKSGLKQHDADLDPLIETSDDKTLASKATTDVEQASQINVNASSIPVRDEAKETSINKNGSVISSHENNPEGNDKTDEISPDEGPINREESIGSILSTSTSFDEEELGYQCHNHDALVAEAQAKRIIVVDGSKYERVRELGKGANGTVSLVRHRVTGQKFALKEQPKQAPDEFSVEAQIFSRLNSNRIVGFQGIIVHPGRHQLLLEYCDGGDLQEFLESNLTRYSEDFMWHLFAQLSEAVAAVHRAGFIHGDIKTQNIMVMQPRPEQQFPDLKLGDFGTATCWPDPDLPRPFAGTYTWMAPEALEKYNTKNDVWAIGAIMHLFAHKTLPHIYKAPDWRSLLQCYRQHRKGVQKKYPSLPWEYFCKSMFELSKYRTQVVPVAADHFGRMHGQPYSRVLNFLIMMSLQIDNHRRIDSDMLAKLVPVLQDLQESLNSRGQGDVLENFEYGTELFNPDGGHSVTVSQVVSELYIQVLRRGQAIRARYEVMLNPLLQFMEKADLDSAVEEQLRLRGWR